MTAVGTPLYIAPEIWAREQYDESIDMYASCATLALGAPSLCRQPTLRLPHAHRRYAFGLLLFELVTKVQPLLSEYTRRGRAGFIAALRGGMRPIIPPRVPAALAELMRRCWHVDPGRRELPDSAVATIEFALQSETATSAKADGGLPPTRGPSASVAAVAPAVAPAEPSPPETLVRAACRRRPLCRARSPLIGQRRGSLAVDGRRAWLCATPDAQREPRRGRGSLGAARSALVGGEGRGVAHSESGVWRGEHVAARARGIEAGRIEAALEETARPENAGGLQS